MVGQCPECKKFSLFKYKEKQGNITNIKVKCASCGYEDTLDWFVTPHEDDEDDDDEDEEDEDDDE